MDSVYACDLRRREELRDLKPTPGYCIFIDIVNSVALKDEGLSAWCDAMFRVVGKSRNWLDYFGDEENNKPDDFFLQQRGLLPLKIMGDCIMFYIPETTMPPHVSAMSLFSSLQYIIREYPRPEVRIAATFCEDAYAITFVEGTNDIHGKDIDLTARLLKEANPQEIVMNEAFVWKARPVFEGRWSNHDFREFGEVIGPCPTSLKGFKRPEKIYRWPGPRFESNGSS